MECLSQERDGRLTLTVYVQPKASQNRLAGLHNGAMKLCITAPPVDGKANTAVIAFLAKLFRLPKSRLTLHSGHQGRTKRLLIEGLTLAEAEALLSAQLD